MLCRRCHRRLDRDATICGACGSPRLGVRAPLELALDDGTRVPLLGEMTIGRASGMTLRLEDPSVSRSHARIIPADDPSEAILEDAGSSYGTFLDGSRVTAPTALYAGAELQVGDARLTIQARSEQATASRTIIVPFASSLVLPSAGGAPHLHSDTGSPDSRPRVRSGYALKRVEGDEANGRWVLRDLRRGAFLRLDDDDAQLFELLDGTRSLGELIGERPSSASGARGRHGCAAAGRSRRARLPRRRRRHGVDAAAAGVAGCDACWAHTHGRPNAPGAAFEALYRAGGWVLFTRPALVARHRAGGRRRSGVFAAWSLGRYGTPFVVASHIGLGGLVFLLGRLPRRRAARDRARAGAGVVRAQGAPRRAQARADLPVRVRGHLGGVVRAAPRGGSRSAPPGRCRTSSSGRSFAICCAALPGTTCATCSSSSRSPPTSARSSTSTRSSIATATRSSSTSWASRACAPARVSSCVGGPAGERIRRRVGAGALRRWPGSRWSVVMAGFGVALSLRYAADLRQYASATVVWALLATAWAAMLVPIAVAVAPMLRRDGARRAAQPRTEV